MSDKRSALDTLSAAEKATVLDELLAARPDLRELAEAGLKKVEGIKHFINVCEHIAEDPAVTGYPHA